MEVTFDERTQRALDWIEGVIRNGVPERIAYKRAEKRFGFDRKMLRILRGMESK